MFWADIYTWQKICSALRSRNSITGSLFDFDGAINTPWLTQSPASWNVPSYRRVICYHTFKGWEDLEGLEKGRPSSQIIQLFKQFAIPTGRGEGSVVCASSSFSPQINIRRTGLAVDKPDTHVTFMANRPWRGGKMDRTLSIAGQLWEMRQRKGEDAG